MVHHKCIKNEGKYCGKKQNRLSVAVHCIPCGLFEIDDSGSASEIIEKL